MLASMRSPHVCTHAETQSRKLQSCIEYATVPPCHDTLATLQTTPVPRQHTWLCMRVCGWRHCEPWHSWVGAAMRACSGALLPPAPHLALGLAAAAGLQTPDHLKTTTAEEAFNKNGLSQRTIRLLKDAFPDLEVGPGRAMDWGLARGLHAGPRGGSTGSTGMGPCVPVQLAVEAKMLQASKRTSGRDGSASSCSQSSQA
jgi:hypothetical protein